MRELKNISERGVCEIGMKVYDAYTRVLSKRPVSFKINNVRILMFIDDE